LQETGDLVDMEMMRKFSGFTSRCRTPFLTTEREGGRETGEDPITLALQQSLVKEKNEYP
jgi:hypothetical protein